jgi:hypothetical protein
MNSKRRKRKRFPAVAAMLALIAVATLGSSDARAQHARGHHPGPVRGYGYARPGYVRPRYGSGFYNGYGVPGGSYGNYYYYNYYGPSSGYGYSSGYGPNSGSSFYYYSPGYGYSFRRGYCR